MKLSGWPPSAQLNLDIFIKWVYPLIIQKIKNAEYMINETSDFHYLYIRQVTGNTKAVKVFGLTAFLGEDYYKWPPLFFLRDIGFGKFSHNKEVLIKSVYMLPVYCTDVIF